MRMGWIGLLLGVMSACESDFEPPAIPVHNDREDGYLHARDKDLPFLCTDPTTGQRVACPIGRPAVENLSCDAVGCHGDNDYSEVLPADERALHGSDGPSCYTCHNREWSARVQ